MPKRQVTLTRYQCDGPGCKVTSDDLEFVRSHWIMLRVPSRIHAASNRLKYLHRVECAIAYLSDMNNGFDANLIRAHIGEARPA